MSKKDELIAALPGFQNLVADFIMEDMEQHNTLYTPEQIERAVTAMFLQAIDQILLKIGEKLIKKADRMNKELAQPTNWDADPNRTLN